MRWHLVLKRKELELRIKVHEHAIELEQSKLECAKLELEWFDIMTRIDGDSDEEG
jgi:hypothetical protein